MGESYIKKIEINDKKILRKNTLEIDKEFKHIGITGFSGSGKTTLIKGIWDYLNSFKEQEYTNVSTLNHDIWVCKKQLMFLRNEEILTEHSKSEIIKLKGQERYYESKKEKYCSTVTLNISENEDLQKRFNEEKFLVGFYETKRDVTIKKEEIETNTISKFFKVVKEVMDIREEAVYIGDMVEVAKIDKWYKTIGKFVKVVLRKNEIDIKITEEGLKIKEEGLKIKEEGLDEYSLEDLSDGQRDILKIIFELIGRMSDFANWKWEKNGIILIDGIDTYSDRKMIQSIIPLLDKYFPNIQFIISTQNREVLKKINNIKIYNLNEVKR